MMILNANNTKYMVERLPPKYKVITIPDALE